MLMVGCSSVILLQLPTVTLTETSANLLKTQLNGKVFVLENPLRGIGVGSDGTAGLTRRRGRCNRLQERTGAITVPNTLQAGEV